MKQTSAPELRSSRGGGGVLRLLRGPLLASAITLPAALLTGSSLPAQVHDAECTWCHGHVSITEQSPEALLAMVKTPPGPISERPLERLGSLYVPEEPLRESAHSALVCVDCHREIEALPHDQRLATVDCSRCHEGIREALGASAHAPEAATDGHRRPGCLDCHGAPHEIRPVKHPRDYEFAESMVEACSRCHMERGPDGPPPSDTYRDNVHGHALHHKGLAVAAICSDCHGSHSVLPPSDPESTLYPLQVPRTCGACHEGVADVYFNSVHGTHLLSGDLGAATCIGCHDSHGIGEIDEPFLTHLVKECSDCHIDLGRSYLLSYHGKATTLGGNGAAVCSSCHGYHDILPVENLASRVAPGNRVETCGQCHEGANENFVEYIAHVDYSDSSKNAFVYWTRVAMLGLLGAVLLIFIPHSLLWFLREGISRLLGRGARPVHRRWPLGRTIERFRPIHRWTHSLIVISFMGLVATGFPLKYSHTDWAQSIAQTLGGVGVLGLTHRILAVLTFGYAAVHVGYLVWFFVKKCSRPRWKFLFGPDSMLFSPRDLKDFVGMVRWFLFLGPKPRFERWSYLEKFDYWGEIWGVFVIGGSGLLLWFPTQFTRWLPGWVLNCAVVIHSIEALLAASVIFLVHFLNTHLRPDKFPVDLVMLTGKMPESDMAEERGDEYDRLVRTGRLTERIVTPVPSSWRIFGRITGIAAFLTGLALIIFALLTELHYRFGFFAGSGLLD